MFFKKENFKKDDFLLLMFYVVDLYDMKMIKNLTFDIFE